MATLFSFFLAEVLAKVVSEFGVSRGGKTLLRNLLQENLGHATASFTLSTYAHSTPGMKKESANRMGQYIKSLQSNAG